MELKLEKTWFVASEQVSFNRTFMELKSKKEQAEYAELQVLIVPLWN